MQIRVDNFGGVILTKDAKKGPFYSALQASNALVEAGDVDVTYSLDFTSAQDVPLGSTPMKTLYNITGSQFCMWTTDVDVVYSPIADNSLRRIYYTGDGVPKTTDAGLATLNNAPLFPQIFYTFGIPIPKNFANSPGAVVLAVTSGAAPVETRAYTYTFVSPWGEESAPCDPVQANGNSTGGTWRLRFIGPVSGKFDANGYQLGAAATLGWGGGVVNFGLTTVADVKQFRVGDLVLCESAGAGTADLYRTALVLSSVNTGTGVMMAEWGGPVAAAAVNIWRVGPINTYNITNAVKDTPVVGQVKVTVDVVHGLRVGDKVYFKNVVGMTDLNTTFGNTPLFTVLAINNNPNDVSIVIALATAQVYTSGGEAYREAPHNTGARKIKNVTFAAGVVTVHVDSTGGGIPQEGGTAHMAVGDKILLTGIVGAVEANGLRTITAITTGADFTFALPAMSAYVGGGIALLSTPYPFTEYGLSLVTYTGGGSFFTFTVNTAHDIVAGDQICVYDVQGMVEANNLFIVLSVVGNQINAATQYGAVTAYTAGGKLVRVKHPCRKRIYRTNQSLAGAADFQFVAEIGNEKCDYNDAIESSNLSSTILPSSGWIQPPADLVGLVLHPHGFLVSYSPSLRSLCFSEPYQPHAWPQAYQRAIGPDVVGLGLFATTTVVLTKDKPVKVTGTHPQAMFVVRQDVGEPCTSKRSITSAGLGVVYRGTSGFYIMGPANAYNATRNYLKPDGFIAQSDTVSIFWRNKIVWIDNATLSGFIFDPVFEDKGLTQFDVDYPVYGLHISPIDGQLYASYFKPNGTQPAFAPLFKITATPARFTYLTQYLPAPKPVSMGVLQVDWAWADQSAAMKGREAAIIANKRLRRDGFAAVNDNAIDVMSINGDGFQTPYSPDTTLIEPTEAYLKVTVIANPDKADLTKIVFDDFVVNGDPIRLNCGILADTWQMKLVGNRKVTAATIAETVEELSLS